MVKRLDLTAIVYVLFLGLCVAGVRSWRRAQQQGGGVAASEQLVAVSGGSVR